MGKQIGCLTETGSVLVTTGWHLEGGATSVCPGDFQRAEWAPDAPVAGADMEQHREPLRVSWSPTSLFYPHCSAHLKVNIVQAGPENQHTEIFLNHMFL